MAYVDGIHIPGSFHVIESKLVTNSWGLLVMLPCVFVVLCSILQQEQAVRLYSEAVSLLEDRCAGTPACHTCMELWSLLFPGGSQQRHLPSKAKRHMQL